MVFENVPQFMTILSIRRVFSVSEDAILFSYWPPVTTSRTIPSLVGQLPLPWVNVSPDSFKVADEIIANG